MKKIKFATLLIPIFCISLAFAQEPKRPRITGISHVAVFVHNMDSSFAFYKDFLGYEEPFRIKKADSSISTVFIKVNDTQCIELFPERGEGNDRLYQVAFITDNAEALRVYLASQGVKVPAKVGKGRIGNYNFTCKDPDGHTVEIVQYEPDGWTMIDAGKHVSDARVSTHLKHIGFAVDFLERSMKFYRDILGFQETWRGSRDGKQLSWVNMRVPDGTDYVEFMLYQDPPTMERLHTMNHLSLEVADIQKAVNHLEARSARKSYSQKMEVKAGINRKRQCNLFDPDGTRTEIMEPGTVDGIPTPPSKAPAPRM
jgi:catechol 2,3-dioxygenase-like lactoylglutathione lyase family enzyme